MRDNYDIGYLDGRNHAIALVVKWVEKALSKRHSSDDIMRILSDRDSLEAALFDFDRKRSVLAERANLLP